MGFGTGDARFLWGISDRKKKQMLSRDNNEKKKIA